MKNELKKISALFISLCWIAVAKAQPAVEMADSMRSNGKIYVVVAVCMIILTGLFIYLFSLDRKISRIEKNRE
jgi:CcmD family protein